jgi:uncharacterized protein (TIGR01777 family)
MRSWWLCFGKKDLIWEYHHSLHGGHRMNNIVIAGASGFIGRILAKRLLGSGNRVAGLGTSQRSPLAGVDERFTWISADTTAPGKWQKALEKADIVINLTGRNIFSYWTKRYKNAIYDSRVKTTKNIADALSGSGQVLLNASAVGVYGDCGDDMLTEDRPAGRDFLARVCRDWEDEAQKAVDKGVRLAVMRLGVVLGSGGALEKMLPAFKLFLGGPLGNGQQWFPWIHIDDLARAVDFLIDTPEASGAFNFTGPKPVRQKEFARALAACLHRPSIMPAPAVMIRLVMGELGASLLQSQKAVPGRLSDLGFTFRYPDVGTALAQILKS